MVAEHYPQQRRVGGPRSRASEDAEVSLLSGVDQFRLEDLALGPHAHGFGSTEDGRTFSFRVVGSTLALRVYRPDLDPSTVPSSADAVASVRAGVTDVDLSDERSVVAMVRDLLTRAESPRGRSALDRALGWLPGWPG